MPRVKIVDVIDYLDFRIMDALREAIDNVLSEATYDEYELLRQFKLARGHKCAVWEYVPDRCVEMDKF